jgi:hypothetical protein
MAAYNDFALIRPQTTRPPISCARIRGSSKTQRSPKLLCMDYAVGAKRICVDINYFAIFSRPNVTLVDIRSAPIEAIMPIGVRQAGLVHAVDTIHLCLRPALMP